MKIIRIIILLIVLALFGYGLFYESRSVESLDGKTKAEVTGAEFVRGATSDRYLRQGKRLIDRNSTLDKKSDAATISDCPT